MRQLAEDVWRLESTASGPDLMIIGGVHGNELPGIHAVRALHRRFTSAPHELKCGTLTLALGNPKAIARGTRGSKDHRDLNRCFTDEALDRGSTYEERRAKELAAIMDDDIDWMLDLHSTNKPSEPFTATTWLTPLHYLPMSCCDVDRALLVLPRAISGTTDSWMHREHGRVGLVYESGYIADVSGPTRCDMAAAKLLGALGMTDDPHPPLEHLVPPTVYVLDRPVLLTDEGFAFEPGRGQRSWEPMMKDDLIGRTLTGTEIRAPYDGVLMFPKVPELWKVGNPIVTFACPPEALPEEDVP